MRFRNRRYAALIGGLAAVVLLCGAQIDQYPVGATKFGPGEPRLKVYPNLSQPEIKKVMEKMSKQIGAKCDLCHNEKDYASEEKPVKDFARHKLLMLRWLNDRWRPKTVTWQYTCYSCHRGELKPITPQTLDLGEGKKP